MNVLVDLSVVADALMFKKFIEILRTRGHRVLVTYRGIRELHNVQLGLGLEGVLCGGYGHDLESKLLASSRRIAAMADLVHIFLEGKLDAVVSNTGVEACRVGFGLAARVHTFWDHPQAIPQAKLTLPLSSYVYYPWTIDDRCLEEHGVSADRRVPYKGFLHLAWVRDVPVNESIVADLGLNPDQSVILFRHSETGAAYLFGRKDITIDAVTFLAKQHPECQFVTKLRYRTDDPRELFRGLRNVHVYDRFIDLQSLVAKASLVVGGGATINLEASFYGVPIIACRQIDSPIDDFLSRNGFAFKASTVQDVVEHFNETNLDEKRVAHAEAVYHDMWFPLDKLIMNVEAR